MKKFRSLNFNKKLLSLGTFLSLGILGVFLLNRYLEESYNARKSLLEDKLEKYLNKKVDLGNYSGIRLLGISLSNSKIIDKKDINSVIKAKNTYVGIMPIRSFLNQKWIISIRPKKTEININKDFFNRKKNFINDKKIIKDQIKYDLNFNLKEFTNFNIQEFGIETRVKGDLIYKSNTKNVIGDIKSDFKGKGNLKLKFNTKLNQDFLKVKILTNGVNLEGSEYFNRDRKFALKEGKLKSNLIFYKSPKKTFCKGNFSLDKLTLYTNTLQENINSDYLRFLCKGNNLLAETSNLNYGTLISDFNLKIPLNKSINNINLKGSIGYLNSLNPEIKLSGSIPYWFDKRGLNFGNINSSFNLTRTQLSNLNIFRRNRIRGFITAIGELKGEINNPDILINFNVDYPHYKGIRIREIWQGEIKNEKNKFMINMNNRYSPIPSFLTFKLNSKIRLEDLTFSRVFNSNKGSLSIVRDDDKYKWNADNFPLDELELAIGNDEFDRISGIINGSGFISKDQSLYDGRLAWSLGRYRNIKFANSLFDFTFRGNSFYVNSSLYPIDGGMIDVAFDSNKKNIFNINFNNISTSWTLLTAVDIFNFENNKIIPNGTSKLLNDLQITKNDKSFEEKISFINNFLKENIIHDDKYNFKKYLNKFDSRYNAKLTIEGDSPSNYILKTRLNGFIDVKNSISERLREEFSIDLEGGFLTGQGLLKVNQLPLRTANIFLNKPRDFEGNIDINLLYDLDNRSFATEISSNNTAIKKNQISFDIGKVDYKKSILDVNFSLLLNNSNIPINILGSIPLNRVDKLDLRLNGNGRFIELIDILADDYFTFNKGDVNLRMIIKGSINKPIANGFIVINDSEVDIYKNIIKDINSTIIFDFDHLEIKNFKASGEDAGEVFIKGSLPFYDKNNVGKNDISLVTNRFNIKSKNIQFLVDSNLNINGSFNNLLLGGNLALNNGFINFNNNNKNNINNNNIKEKNFKKNWPELYWGKDKDLEIISNETILNSFLLRRNLPNYLERLSFNNLKLKLGPDFRLQYSELVKAYLDTKLDLNINGNLRKNLNARGLINLNKGRANLYTTPFKLDKNKENYILFASRNGIVPFINFSLISKVPDSIIPISENNQDTNISSTFSSNDSSSGFGTFGIGNTRLIKIEASYQGFLDQLSFEDENKKIQLRSTPSYSRSQIIGLIGGNSSNLINRAFISQLNSSNAFSERFQLSLYPALIENNEPINNVFTSENLNIDDTEEATSNEALSSQAWVAEIGLDITDRINFAIQATPDRDDLPPLGILTLQANPNLELLGSFDSNGDWKSQVQLFFRY